MSPLSAEALEAKAQTIRAFFDNFEEKVAFARGLHENGRRDEAFILCCAYIEGMATHLNAPSHRSRENFCQVLLQHGGEDVFRLVHPRALATSIAGLDAAIASKLKALDPDDLKEMRPIEEFLPFVSPHISSEELELLRKNVHLGTLASITYTELRCAFAHRGGGPSRISFDDSTFEGGPAPELDLETLFRALGRVVAHARSISEESNKFFGKD